MDSQLPKRVVDEPPGDLGADTLSPPLPFQGDTQRALVSLRAGSGGDQADVADERLRLLFFHQSHEPRKVLVGRRHLLDPLVQSVRDVVGECERLDFRVVVQVKEEVAVAGLEGTHYRPLRFEWHGRWQWLTKG